jgi:hypothetical protein
MRATAIVSIANSQGFLVFNPVRHAITYSTKGASIMVSITAALNA